MAHQKRGSTLRGQKFRRANHGARPYRGRKQSWRTLNNGHFIKGRRTKNSGGT